MNGRALRQSVRIRNPQGFHMRPKANFARVATSFESKITLTWTDRTVDGKSMFDLMLLAAPEGDEIVIEVEGSDAESALEALVPILESPGDEDGDEDGDDPSPRLSSEGATA